MRQIPFPPPLPPGFVPPPMDVFAWVCLYVMFLELVLLAFPRNWSNRILEILLPGLRRYW